MSDYPTSTLPPNITIWPWSFESIGFMGQATNVLFVSTAGGRPAWPTANLALFVPFTLLEPITVKAFMWYNYAPSGNVDAGVYDKDGNLLGSIGGIAGSGNNQIQSSAVTNFSCGPGLFYMTLVWDNTTVTMFQATSFTGGATALGLYQMASAYPLPAVATFATCVTERVPVMALTTRTLI
jgi:hypothetical protein